MNRQLQNGKAYTTKKIFSRTTTISKLISSAPELIWQVLLDVDNYTRWNSTITMMEGDIKVGSTIRLKSYLDDKRIFKLKVKEVIPNQKLVWGDAMGRRTFSIRKEGNSSLFVMTEKIGGPLFPLFARMIPSFDESFERFAADLEREVTNK